MYVDEVEAEGAALILYVFIKYLYGNFCMYLKTKIFVIFTNILPSQFISDLSFTLAPSQILGSLYTKFVYVSQSPNWHPIGHEDVLELDGGGGRVAVSPTCP